MATYPIDGKFVARFWSRVNRNGPVAASGFGPCWLWTASKTRAGYGNINVGSGNVYAHRLSWMIHHGADVPHGLQIAHLCGQRDCVNPAHLTAATQSENEGHKAAHGRNNYAIGNDVACAKLTAEKVAEIRQRVAAGGESLRALGREYGVTHTTLLAMLSGRTWSHVP